MRCAGTGHGICRVPRAARSPPAPAVAIAGRGGRAAEAIGLRAGGRRSASATAARSKPPRARAMANAAKTPQRLRHGRAIKAAFVASAGRPPILAALLSTPPSLPVALGPASQLAPRAPPARLPGACRRFLSLPATNRASRPAPARAPGALSALNCSTSSITSSIMSIMRSRSFLSPYRQSRYRGSCTWRSKSARWPELTDPLYTPCGIVLYSYPLPVDDRSISDILIASAICDSSMPSRSASLYLLPISLLLSRTICHAIAPATATTPPTTASTAGNMALAISAATSADAEPSAGRAASGAAAAAPPWTGSA